MKGGSNLAPKRRETESRINIMGCWIDNLSMQETLLAIERLVNSKRPNQHVVVNVDKIVKAHRDPQLMDVINGCDLVNVDGMPVVWASKLLGRPLKERVTGVDLFYRLIDLAEKRNWRVYFLGAKEEIVKKVVTRLLAKHPALNIAGHHHGYWELDQELSIVDQIKKSQADLLFVAISSPKKEQFLGRYQKQMGVSFSMGVGGTFDIVAGIAKRAPRWMQKVGLEWFYRFLQEPRRMFKRYFVDDMYFFWLLAKEVMKERT